MWNGSRRRRAVGALLVAGALALGGGLQRPGEARAGVEPTVAVFQDVLVPAGYRELPGVRVRLSARPGQRFVVHADRFSLRTMEPLTGAEYLGTTAALFCPGQRPPNGMHSGNNIVPVLNETLRPALRWVFEAPHTSGTQAYTCTVAVAFYSSDAPAGTDVRASAATGLVRLHAESAYTGVGRWVLPATLDPVQGAWTVIPAGGTAEPLAHLYRPVTGRPALAVRQDAQLSTCKRSTPYRACPVGRHQFSSVETRVHAQPVDPAGADCGAPVEGPVSTARISAAEHHRTMSNSLELTKSDLPAGCGDLRLSLRVRVLGGDPVLVHGGYASAGEAATAYSHGYAYEYEPDGPVLKDQVAWAAPVSR
ncbi:hypothetical protein [Streptomyces sp. SP18CS02]|uniref:hypothetical protein n=1 Tax=Streptomyces sp. SP18CS02 TaxID=3002531 RepID=UPI002E790C92|nr:hypothetical protein [Streptomyces sp. SP18CS02]MEE1756760.1 hypothetical protein [Streptomyces sp. SP18CS02]